MDTGLLVVRVLVGLLMIGHGTQKLFGWFGGHGLTGTGAFMESLGYRPGKPHAALAGLGEAGGGLLFAVGLVTPLAAAILVGVMVNAIVSAHWENGIWVTNGGYELPLVYAVVAVAVACIGPGTVSLDNALGWHLAGVEWGFAAAVLGAAAAAGPLLSRNTQVAEGADAAEGESKVA
jgi:putative oxidoreductase